MAALVCLGVATTLDGHSRSSSVQARERVAYVSVLDEQTLEPITALTPAALDIREDGTRREILRVEPATSPMPVAILVDNSQAAAPTIADLRRGLETLLTRLEGVGPLALFTIADRPTLLQGYTTSMPELREAAGRVFHVPGSGTTLLDAVAEVSKGLAKRETDRAAIIVITGENTEFSTLHYRDVLEPLRDSGVMMFAVVLVNPSGPFMTDEARNRAVVLDRGPKESGGRRFDVLTSMSFDTRLDSLARLLKAQHRVVYARPEALIPPEKFEVSATTPGHQAYGAPARGQGR